MPDTAGRGFVAVIQSFRRPSDRPGWYKWVQMPHHTRELKDAFDEDPELETDSDQLDDTDSDQIDRVIMQVSPSVSAAARQGFFSDSPRGYR